MHPLAVRGAGVVEVVTAVFIGAAITYVANLIFGGTPEVPLAEVISTRGDAKLNGQAIKNGPFELESLTEFTTGPDSLINLQMPDGSRLSLSEETHLIVAEAEPVEGTDLFKTTLELEAGEIISKLPKPRDGVKRQTRLHTPSVTIGVRGTTFVASAVPGESRTMVTNGEVTLSDQAGRAMALPSNFGTITKTGKASEPPTVLPLPPVPASPEDGSTLVPGNATLYWTPNADAQRYVVEIADDEGVFDSVILRKEAPNPLFQPALLPADGDYHWRVASVDVRGLRGRGSEPRRIVERRHLHRVRELRNQGRIDEALLHAGPALENHPKDAEALTEVGRVHFEAGDYEFARAHYDRAIMGSKPDAARLVLRGNANLRLGDSIAARSDFRTAVLVDPRSADAYTGLGEVDLIEEKLESAEEHFKQAVVNDPQHPKAHLGLGKAALARGDQPEAHRHVDRHIEVNPDDPEGHEWHDKVR